LIAPFLVNSLKDKQFSLLATARAASIVPITDDPRKRDKLPERADDIGIFTGVARWTSEEHSLPPVTM